LDIPDGAAGLGQEVDELTLLNESSRFLFLGFPRSAPQTLGVVIFNKVFEKHYPWRRMLDGLLLRDLTRSSLIPVERQLCTAPFI